MVVIMIRSLLVACACSLGCKAPLVGHEGGLDRGDFLNQVADQLLHAGIESKRIRPSGEEIFFSNEAMHRALSRRVDWLYGRQTDVKVGSVTWEAIHDGRGLVAMSPEMVLAAMGGPHSTRQELAEDEYIETWIYGDVMVSIDHNFRIHVAPYLSVVFSDGRVISVQDWPISAEVLD